MDATVSDRVTPFCPFNADAPDFAIFCRVPGGVEKRLGVELVPAMRISTRRRARGSQPGRAAVWKMPTRARTYHAVQEEGVSLRNIAEAIGNGLKVPVVSIPAENAGEHFRPFFGHAATQDMPSSSEWTRKTLAWEPAGPGMIEDLTNMKY